MSIKQNKKGSAKAKLSWPFFPRGKKGIEMTMQLIVVVIIMLALLVFLLIFLTGQGGKVTALWENITIGAVQSAGP
jgi:flagellar basal body-associated protein FliL